MMSLNWGGSRYALVQVPQSVQSATGPIPRKISLKINVLDRRISVAPMMDWTDSAEMSGSTGSYEGQKAR